MTKIPGPINTLPALIDKAHEEKAELPRPHLGASQIGHPCERNLWLGFRWAKRPSFPGRILRLFRRGHHEEEWIIEDLRMAGVTIHPVDPETGNQWFFKDGHFGGSMDGIIEAGVPEAPSKPHIFEAKTHSLKSFKDLKAKGVEKSKPQHLAQMNVYMLSMGIDRGQYVAVCKDNDEIYTERVKLSKRYAQGLMDKAQYIIASDRMPEPISSDPSWYECKLCDNWEFCHQIHTVKEVNCRTCAHSTAKRDGTWHCALWDSEIPTVDAQRAGCEDHVIHPDLVPWKLIGGDSVSAIYEIDGQEVRVGRGGMKSGELLGGSDA